jgi:hypothetical protein
MSATSAPDDQRQLCVWWSRHSRSLNGAPGNVFMGNSCAWRPTHSFQGEQQGSTCSLSICLCATGVGWEDAEEEEDDDGWVVQTPFLPPPPSQPDQVEQWMRAMFADPNALASSGQQVSSSGSGSLGLASGLGLAIPGMRGLGAAGGLVRAGLAGAAGSVNLGSSPSGSGGFMPMERIRSLFG